MLLVGIQGNLVLPVGIQGNLVLHHNLGLLEVIQDNRDHREVQEVQDLPVHQGLQRILQTLTEGLLDLLVEGHRDHLGLQDLLGLQDQLLAQGCRVWGRQVLSLLDQELDRRDHLEVSYLQRANLRHNSIRWLDQGLCLCL